MPKQLAHLSNGEMRKVLLVRALLKQPDLLVLEDACAGLDQATRRKLMEVISALARQGWPILVATHRPEERPPTTTHILLVDGFRVVAERLIATVDRVVSQTSVSLIFVTHHRDELRRCITHILRLRSGVVFERGPLSASAHTK